MRISDWSSDVCSSDLDEMFEMLTWRQLGLGNKPCAFLDVDDFYDPLLAMMDRMVAERFLHLDQRQDLWHGDDIDGLIRWLRAYTRSEEHTSELQPPIGLT